MCILIVVIINYIHNNFSRNTYMENSFLTEDYSPMESDHIDENLPVEMSVEDIVGIDIDVEQMRLTCEGETSFATKYDQGKKEFLEKFNIDCEGYDHAEVVTTFILFKHIVGLKKIESENGNLSKAVEIANEKIREQRIDTVGEREDLSSDGSGLTYEKALKSLGYTSNPSCKVSELEYKKILADTLSSLKMK